VTREVMTSPVLSAQVDWPVSRAAELMARWGFTLLPVVDGHEQLVGVVGDGDVLLDRIDSADGTRHTVHDVMTTEVLTAPPSLHLARLARRMVSGGRRVIPVVDDGRLVGIVTRRDLLRAADLRGTGKGR
jgi:CBS domain-containing protein